MSIEALLAQANAAAETSADMNEAVKGGSGARLLPEGYAFGRLVEYVELGKHPQEFAGVAKEPSLEVQLAFALWGQGYQNDDGTPYIVRPYRFAVSRNEKARAFKLFKALNWKNTAKTFAQLLSQAYLVKIVNQAKSKTDATLVSRIDFAGFLPPIDPVTKAPYNIPDADPSLYKLFLWDYPSKTAWDSMYVEGKFDDGNSKNFNQEYILSATDFAGSALDLLLSASGLALPTAATALPAAPALPAGVGYAPAFSAPPAAPEVAPTAPLAPVLPTQPAISVVPPAQAPVVPAGPVTPIAPTPAVTPTLPQTAPSSPVTPVAPLAPVMPIQPIAPVLPQ